MQQRCAAMCNDTIEGLLSTGRELALSSDLNRIEEPRHVQIGASEKPNSLASKTQRGVAGGGLTGEAHDRLITSLEHDVCLLGPQKPRDSVCARLRRQEF